VLQAGLGGLLVVVTRAHLGLCPPRLWAGLRLGLAAGSAAATGILAATSLPAVRLSMVERELPASASAWLVWQIPLGTVWGEEAAFRAALAAVAARVYGTSGGRLLQAAAFGLSHIADARATGEPVLAHGAGYRRRGLGIRLASRTFRQPERADAGALGDQRGGCGCGADHPAELST